MAIPVLIIGRSGAGKSASMRNCDPDKWGLIKVLQKPLPFRSKLKEVVTDDYRKVEEYLRKSKSDSMVVDDAGYLITNFFMRNHSTKGTGNQIFTMYNTIADNFWGLIEFIIHLPENKIVYVIMHEDIDEFGNIKAKTIGKMIDEKICLEGMFTIVLRAVHENGGYRFATNSEGGAISKSPIGMFENIEIDNDLQYVDDTIRKYYAEENVNE